MKVIDLRQSRWFPEKWWIGYLAYLASTPRNWVERKLEPQVQDRDSQIRVIDVLEPEEGVANAYPTEGLTAYWTILCLDGAPERMKYHTQVCGKAISFARILLAPAENRFRALIKNLAGELAEKPSVHVQGNWHDGAILGYETRQSAIEIAKLIGRACEAINLREGLPWDRQFHVRAGIGLSVADAFTALLHAHRDQICTKEREQSKVSGSNGKMVTVHV